MKFSHRRLALAQSRRLFGRYGTCVCKGYISYIINDMLMLILITDECIIIHPFSANIDTRRELMDNAGTYESFMSGKANSFKVLAFNHTLFSGEHTSFIKQNLYFAVLC